MSLNPKAVGIETAELRHDYDSRELSLYALSVGAAPETELDLILERDGRCRALPTYAVVPALAAVEALQSAMECELSGILHGAQRIRIHKPVPSSGPLFTRGKLVGIYDLRRMASSVIETSTVDADGALIAETEWTIFHTTEGGFGGEAPPRQPIRRAPQRKPDATVELQTSAIQACLYRLNGDRNPLHADPEVAQRAGFERPILHGLCTYAMAGIALLRAGLPFIDVRAFEASFRAPVFPGETLVTEIWRDGKHAWLRSFVRERPDAIALQHGCVELG